MSVSESIEEKFNEKKKMKSSCLTLVFPKEDKKRKFSLTYHNRVYLSLLTILTYVLPRVKNPLIINLHTICINYLEDLNARRLLTETDDCLGPTTTGSLYGKTWKTDASKRNSAEIRLVKLTNRYFSCTHFKLEQLL